jgi:hypothetical protein
MQSVHITTKGVSLNPAWLGVLDTTLCDKVYQWLAAGLWFSPGTTPISWEAFFDPSDSYFLFAEERGYHKWALAHSSSCFCYNDFPFSIFPLTWFMWLETLHQQSRQTGSTNLMGPKTLPTIWGTYMKLVTKYQISAINSCWEKCEEKCAYMFNVYRNQPSRLTSVRLSGNNLSLFKLWKAFKENSAAC